MAPSRYTDHLSTVCRAYPCTSVSNKSLIILTIKYIPSSPALILPKIKNLLQNFCKVDVTIFSMDALSIRECNPPCNTEAHPIMILPIVLRNEGRSAENIMWSLSSSKLFCEYMPLVASTPGLIYFHDSLVEGFMIVNAVSTDLGINLYQASLKRYIVGAKELQMVCVPWHICVCGIRKYAVFPRNTGSCS